MKGSITKEDTEFLNECIELLEGGACGEEYWAFVSENKTEMYDDWEYVPNFRKTVNCMKWIFDSFDEICRRLKEENKS